MDDQEKQNSSQPHVRIFNKEINSQAGEDHNNEKHNFYYCHHHHNHHHYGRHSSGGIFGLTVLFLGALLLLNNFGIVSRDVWNYVWPFWPVLLIFMGIRIVAGFNRVVNIFVFIFAFVLYCLIVIYALVHIGSPLVYRFGLSQNFINYVGQLK